MAKKQETRGYGESYIPEGNGKRYSSSRAFMYGLDRRMSGDTSTMSDCENIDVAKLPEIVSVGKAMSFGNCTTDGVLKGFFGYEDKLFFVTENGDTVSLTRVDDNGATTTSWSLSGDKFKDNIIGKNREMAVFCYYNPTGMETSKEQDKPDLFYDMTPTYYLIVAPDRRYVPIDFDGTTEAECDEHSPIFNHITVWNSRLFGARDSVVVCSSAGTFNDWTCDIPETTDASGLTTGGYDASHAWYSTTQANTKSTGDIVAITAYDGHPIIFKDDYMHQINNNKNPFRIQDIVATGCVSARSICELDGVLYFASRDGIYSYSGGYPRIISEPLNSTVYGSDVVCGAYDGVLYMYNQKISGSKIFTYCPQNGLWAMISNPHGDSPIVTFAVNDSGIFSVDENKAVYRYPMGDEKGEPAEWYVKTDRMFSGDAGDKRIHSIEFVASGKDLSVSIIKDALPDESFGSVTIRKEKVVDGSKVDALYGVDKVRAIIRKTDSLWHMLKISGTGEIHIYRADLVYSHSGRRYK